MLYYFSRLLTGLRGNDLLALNESVRLLAVSKGQPFSKIHEAFLAGQRAFGENYLQEALAKIQQANQCGLSGIEWHFIGHLQSNKAKLVAENFDWVQSVDSLALIKQLHAYRSGVPLNICLQVNISHEAQKSGVAVHEVENLADAVLDCPRLCLRGLMAIGLDTQDTDQLHAMYAKMRKLYEQMKARISTMDTLSLGMSRDMNIAIAEGSTMVRIGTAFFGERSK